MDLPQLKPSKRHREYDAYSDQLRLQVVRDWLLLFIGGTY